MSGMSKTICDLKKHILKVACQSNEGHIASSFSILDILYVLYNKVMTEDDQFILSKGHASLALYAILMQQACITQDDFYSFCQFNSKLGGHPNRNKVNGVVASTGSLAHGLPIAVGMAIAEKIKGDHGNRIFCLVGDGELNEGSNYEAMLLANHHKLDNLVVLVDYNHSTDRAVDMESIMLKFMSFGWDTYQVVGHNHFDIETALNHKSKKPYVIVCHTVKGYGCKTMENNPAWHHRSPNDEELILLLKELDEHEKTIC